MFKFLTVVMFVCAALACIGAGMVLVNEKGWEVGLGFIAFGFPFYRFGQYFATK